jgi:fatty-acyl-CoA synthase
MLTTSYWPADTSEPVLEKTVGDVLREAAAEVPDQVALVAGMPQVADRGRWTYAQMLDDSERVARALLNLFQPGERVAVWAPNLAEWVLLEFGAALAGIILVTVNPAFRPKELEYVLKQSGASGIFLVPEFRGNQMAASLDLVRSNLPGLREVIQFPDWAHFLASGSALTTLPHVSPTDAAQIQYTSGTTGFPKGALLHHRGIVNNARFCAQRLGVTAGEVWLNPMPLFHTAGCVLGVLGAVQSHATHIPVLAFEPGLVLELLESERVNVGGAVPTMLIAIMEHPDFGRRDLSSLRCFYSGGTLVPAELVRRIESTLGIRFAIVFGTTECSPLLTQTRLDDSPGDKATTIGQPLPQTEVKIADPASSEIVPVSMRGELCTRGYLVMKGYFEMPDATAAAIDSEGWYHTGDLASMDERGYCRVEGRLKDMIIRGGENIYPREIEDLLFSHPGVAEVTVVGIPDSKYGEVIAAFIRPSPGQSLSEEELFVFCRQHLAPFKTPRYWVFVDTFPLTPSGKIQKFVLRDSFIREDLPRLEAQEQEQKSN